MFSKSFKAMLPIAAVATWAVTGFGASASADAPVARGAVDPGVAIVARTCQSCHDMATVTEARHTAQEWTDVVERMRGNGAELSDQEARQAQAYLAKTYGKPG